MGNHIVIFVVILKRNNVEAKLIKTEKQYVLQNKDGIVIASSFEGGKLSLHNCQAIECGYDLDELALEAFELDLNCQGDCNNYYERLAYKLGMIKMIGLLGDKKFSEEDMSKVWSEGYHRRVDEINGNELRYFDEFIQSQQQTEWDVEFEMEYVGECNGNNDNGCFQDSPGHNCGCFERKPKLDDEGCLILKKYKNG